MALSMDAIAIAASNLAAAEVAARMGNKAGGAKTSDARSALSDAFVFWREALKGNTFSQLDSPP